MGLEWGWSRFLAWGDGRTLVGCFVYNQRLFR